ncbi:MAG: hypothetical protein K1X89_13310 [Myxococcaceae bacterium]|nr:hypothetical protein [Myxococcaceae bacterium]
MWRAAGLAVFIAAVVFSQVEPSLDERPIALALTAPAARPALPRRAVSVEALGRLFFVPQPKVVSAPSRVRVVGTLDGPRPEESLVALEVDGAGRTHLLGVGDRVGACELESVAHGRVWARCDGEKRELRGDAVTPPVTSAAGGPASLVSALGPNRYQVDRARLESELPALLPQLMDGTHLVPHFSQGANDGFRLYFRRGSLFESVGLASGDLLMRVDGEALRPEVVARLLAGLRQRRAAVVEVRRGEAVVELRLEAR